MRFVCQDFCLVSAPFFSCPLPPSPLSPLASLMYMVRKRLACTRTRPPPLSGFVCIFLFPFLWCFGIPDCRTNTGCWPSKRLGLQQQLRDLVPCVSSWVLPGVQFSQVHTTRKGGHHTWFCLAHLGLLVFVIPLFCVMPTSLSAISDHL